MFQLKQLSDTLSYLVSAISNCSMYSMQHPAVDAFSQKAFANLESLLDEDPVVLSLLSDSLIYNEAPLTDMGSHISRLIKRFKVKGIERVVIEKGVTLSEIRRFVQELASLDGNVSSSTHIVIGILEVRHKAEGDLASLVQENLLRTQVVCDGVSRFKSLDIRGVEEIVMGFATALKKEANILRSLSPVKEHSTYTYVHASNVAVLTIFQAEALGLKGESLHDAGQAGLLHDVGKLFIAREILEKPGKLDDSEWNLMKNHPLHGALFLSGQPEVSKIAVIAAYEHHMRYDGNGYPDAKRSTNKQHIISQLVAISDFFDAMRSKRKYQVSKHLPEVMTIIKESSGTYLNPDLVDNFINAFKKVRAI